MNKKRKLTALFLAMCLTSGNAVAAAENPPSSQFGFKGWPYRHANSCGTARPTAAPEITCAPTASLSPAATPDPGPISTPVPDSEIQPSIPPTVSPAATPAASAEPLPPEPTATKAPSTAEDYTTPSISVQEENAFILLNQDRIANDVPALMLDPVLCELARLKSRDMYENHYFSHTSPTYGSANSMLKQFGYSFSAVGENIAHHATIEKAQAAFLSSQGHRRNLLGPQWTRAGIGVWQDDQGFVYVTQLFVR